MFRSISFTVAAVAVAITFSGSVASAAWFQFLPGTVADGDNSFTVLGDGRFEVSDVPKAAPSNHQYAAVTPFDVRVESGDGAGRTFPVVFTLDRVSTTDDHVNMVFMNSTYDDLLVIFDAPGVVRGDMIPNTPITDADGSVRWNAPALIPLSPGIVLAGTLNNASIVSVVPEPTVGCVTLAMLFALIASRQRQRQRQR